MQLRHGFFSFFISALVIGGCTVTEAGTRGIGGASAAQTSRCKESCDKMKFFTCSSASEQAACYADCDAATPAQVDIFTACAENSVCDPECRTSIQPAEKAKAGGGGASAATCETACDKLVSCSLIPVGAKARCNTECSTKGYQYQIDCVNSTACGEILETCGGESSSEVVDDEDSRLPEDTLPDCYRECDQINFFECAPVEFHRACRDECSSASATDRDAFTSCSRSSGVNCESKLGCLDAFLN